MNHDMIKLIRELDPRIPTFAVNKDALRSLISFFFGFLPYISLDFDAVHAPYFTKDFESEIRTHIMSSKSCCKRTVALTILNIAKAVNYLTDGMYLNFDRRGIHTNFWVINDDIEVKYICKNTSMAGIMTDRPAHVRKIL